jgi:multidrug efflux pump subunit AcrA (membrane-fusion protein)
VYTLTQRPVSASVSLSGTLKPLKEIVVSAPFDAKIKERQFTFGQMVEQGKLLLLLDTADLEIQLRKAKSSYIKANQKYRELVEWDSGTEMTRARRSLAKAKDELGVNQRKLEEATLLFEKGIIPAQEVESAKRQMENARVDVQAAREELESVRSQASQENIALAKLELENAGVELDRLEEQMAAKEIRAPVSGVVIKPVQKDNETVSLEEGAEISSGTNLLVVGDLSGVTVESAVDEINVHKISLGQPVKATGAAFPDVMLKGRVSHISAQAATSASQRQGSTFDVRVVFPDLDAKSLDQVRVGMSADLEVLVYENNNALLAPLACVRMLRGSPTVKRLGSDGQVHEQVVETGITTLTSVEILSGIDPGETLIGWNRQRRSKDRGMKQAMP